MQFSWRYAVVGVYFDRHQDLWYLYPIPFVRFTFHRRFR